LSYEEPDDVEGILTFNDNQELHSSTTNLRVANEQLSSSSLRLPVKAQKRDTKANDSFAAIQIDSDDLNRPQSPILEQHFIHDANIDPAPFTKPHFISLSRSAPFLGPHTVIKVPLGPDLGSFVHLPRSLSVDEIKLAELAIFPLWSGHRFSQGLACKAHTIETKLTPLHLSLMTNSQLPGPHIAPYPLAEFFLPPFPGRRTCIYNSGNHLTG
jgi:hypothetical protein